MKQDGKRTTCITLPDNLWAWLKHQAIKEQTSMAKIIAKLIEDYKAKK